MLHFSLPYNFLPIFIFLSFGSSSLFANNPIPPSGLTALDFSPLIATVIGTALLLGLALVWAIKKAITIGGDVSTVTFYFKKK